MRLVAIAMIAACGGEPTATQPVAVPRDAGKLATSDAAPPRLVGVVTAAGSVDITPRIAGVIAKIHVNPGDKVTANQIVAEMDPIQMRDEVRAAEAAAAAAAAASRQASVDVEDAKRKLALETKAVEQGISATSKLDEARLGVKRAEAALQAARSTQAAEGARAQTARDHLNNTGLRAPFAGTVTNRYRDAGNRVEAGAPILRIVGSGKMRLKFAVPPQLAPRLPIGLRVTAHVDSVAAPVVATVKQVQPTIDAASGMIIVEAELDDNQLSELREGLAAEVEMPQTGS